MEFTGSDAAVTEASAGSGLLGGGWIASGPPLVSRQPRAVWPIGLRTMPREAAGEVQTPLQGASAAGLGIGDRVWFRHAKSGEPAERIDAYQLVSGSEIVAELPNYRGEGNLHRIPKLLAHYGLAMQKLGDIDRQSIAGAISTGTHGTGIAFRGIAAQVVGAVLITAEGERLRVDETHSPELLPAVALTKRQTRLPESAPRLPLPRFGRWADLPRLRRTPALGQTAHTGCGAAARPVSAFRRLPGAAEQPRSGAPLHKPVPATGAR